MVSMDVEIVEHNSKDEVIETIVACHYHRKILTHPTLNGGRGEIREKAPTVDRVLPRQLRSHFALRAYPRRILR